MTIRALIVDDEEWARRRIAALLRDEPDFEVAGEADGGEVAVEMLATLRPDVVFLDVEMPDVNGLDVVGALESSSGPLIVFVTAYDQYAVQAFDADAIDYLLKPFDEERFRTTLDRIRRQLASPSATPRYLKRVAVRSGERTLFLKVAEIDRIESSGNYVQVHVGKQAHTIRATISDFETKLDPEQFVRIHRSTIVNLDRVAELQAWFNGEQQLVLKDGTRLAVGRQFRNRLLPLIRNTP